MSIGFHLITPHAKDYFHQAIMESGSPLNIFTSTDESRALSLFRKLAAESGCPLNLLGQSTDETFQCLNSLNSTELFHAASDRLLNGFFPSACSETSNCFFCRQLFDFEENPLEIQVDKPILMGTNSQEGALFAPSLLPAVYPLYKGTPRLMTLEQIAERAGNKRQLVQPILDKFFSDIDGNNGTQARDRVLELLRDYLFVCPDRMFIVERNKAVGEKSPLFYYRYDYRSSQSPWNSEWVTGASHADEMDDVFGMAHTKPFDERYTESEKLLSIKVMSMWTNFAKTGKFELEGQSFTPIDTGSVSHALIDKNGVRERPGFPANLCNLLTVDVYKQVGAFMRTLARAGEMKSSMSRFRRNSQNAVRTLTKTLNSVLNLQVL